MLDFGGCGVVEDVEWKLEWGMDWRMVWAIGIGMELLGKEDIDGTIEIS
jgi:lysyl-tRNA synthetase class I